MFTFEKVCGLWVVRGECSRANGRRKEPYERVFRAKADAARDADRWNRIEAKHAADNAEIRLLRAAAAREYLAKRATRRAIDDQQLSLL
jgi:hypothetical protein